MKSPAIAWKLREQLRAYNFDMTLDPQSLTKSSLLARLSGAACRVGFAAPRGRELAPWLNNALLQAERSHIVDHQLDLLAALGVDDRRVEFRMPIDSAKATTIESYLRATVPDRPFVVINPGAGWESRLWPAERFGLVASFLARSYDLPAVVVWAGPQERVWAERIVQTSEGCAHLAPDTSLPELAALLSKARCYLGSDTGPTHLAAAVGTPCVSLHGTTRPEVSGPYGRQHRFVVATAAVRDRRHRRRASNEAMQTITTESVCDACRGLLDRLDCGESGRAA
jgi:ADP-heptose:LPS heptosyltransferase